MLKHKKSTPKNISKCVKNRILSGRFLEDHCFCQFHLAPEMSLSSYGPNFPLLTVVKLSDVVSNGYRCTPWKVNELVDSRNDGA